MLSYEAAPAFDPAMVTRPPSDFPLAWAATFCRYHANRTDTVLTNTWAPLVTRTEYDRSVIESEN
jgi:hypothetical protein